MKILILGYYHCNNLGDDMFITAYRQLLIEHQLTFCNISDIDNYNLQDYQVVIVGSGDLFNDYFGEKYYDKLTKYNGYKIALGVGTSYQEYLNHNYLNCFDDIYIRNSQDLKIINRKIGSLNVGYIPDLLFSLTLDNKRIRQNNNIVGFFLVGSMFKNKNLMCNICTFINKLILFNYNIELISMCYDISDRDVIINKEIYDIFQSTGKIKLHDKLTEKEFLSIFQHLDLAFCVRFHAHVFCTRYAIPFISLPLTRKNQLFLQDLPENTRYALEVKRNDNYDVISFDNVELDKIFSKLVSNKKEIAESLFHFNNLQERFYGTNKIQQLINNKRKRLITSNERLLNINCEEIYEKYINLILMLGINPLTDNLIDYLSKDKIEEIAKCLCYDLTLQINNEYVIGTSNNLETKHIQLKDMIKWIYNDYNSKLVLGKLNINYLHQNRFSSNRKWQNTINNMLYLCTNFGAYVDTDLFNTFGVNSFILQKDGLLPYTNRWLGIFTDNLIDKIKIIFTKEIFIQSLKYCKGIIILHEKMLPEITQLLNIIHMKDIKVQYLSHDINFVENFINSKIYLEL